MTLIRYDQQTIPISGTMGGGGSALGGATVGGYGDGGAGIVFLDNPCSCMPW